MRCRSPLVAAVAVSVAQFVAVPATGSAATVEQGGIRILFLGNSHTHVNDVPGLVASLIEHTTGVETEVAAAPGTLFLDQRLDDGPSLELLDDGPWTAVVLQAQRYSMSGRRTYPTVEAETLAAMVRDRGAVPILFPEWPRRGVDETDRIYDLHTSIASVSPSCVPPVPQAFDRALLAHPELELHHGDGNHSAPAGALLAAMVLTHAVTGIDPELQVVDPALVPAGVEVRSLVAAAGWAVSGRPPWAWCADVSPVAARTRGSDPASP